jgi:transposase InsO family protein
MPRTFAKRYKIDIAKYHTDNGAFCTATLQKEIDDKGQKLSFSGVNAQWLNGLIERSNGTLCAAARSMLNHAISKWDKTIPPELWQFTILHATTIFNTSKCRSHNNEESPWEQFTGEISKLEQSTMYPLFYPVFILDRRLQECTSYPKWTK